MDESFLRTIPEQIFLLDHHKARSEAKQKLIALVLTGNPARTN